MDETLIHATREPRDDLWDFELNVYKVYIRPYLSQFLESIITDFDVAVWSSASDDYVHQAVTCIFPQDYPLLFVWGRSRCTLRRQSIFDQMDFMYASDHLNYVKRLKKIKKSFGIPFYDMLIVDDTPSKSVENYGNAIYPKAFKGEKDDAELLLLTKYLLTLKDVENVRTIEKRYWKDEL